MNAAIDISDYRWLVGPEGERWLRVAGERELPLHRLAELLRRDLTAAQTHLVLEQLELRGRAVRKFDAGERMFFTRVGLEQATDQWVAAYKAGRLPPGVPVADLCCGIGGDLAALAARGPSVGIDRDPVAALFAAANLATVSPGFAAGSASQSTVRCEDVIQPQGAEIEAFAAWHIDPDRRPRGRRTTRVELHEPNAAQLDRLRAANPQGAIKLAPVAHLPDAWSQDAELEWISRDGECKQLVAWFGELARDAGQRRATLVTSAGGVHSILGAKSAETTTVPPAPRLGRFVFEPDSALLAAKLLGHVAHTHGLHGIAPGSVYLTGDSLPDEPALTAFAVVDVLPLQTRQVKEYLRARSLGRLEIKTRGVEHDPDALRKAWQVPGDGAATLICTPLICTPLPPEVPFRGLGVIVVKRVTSAVDRPDSEP